MSIRSPPKRSTMTPARNAAGTWTSAATPTMSPICGSGTPARDSATGSDAVKPWKPAWRANNARASRSTPPSSRRHRRRAWRRRAPPSRMAPPMSQPVPSRDAARGIPRSRDDGRSDGRQPGPRRFPGQLPGIGPRTAPRSCRSSASRRPRAPRRPHRTPRSWSSACPIPRMSRRCCSDPTASSRVPSPAP